jgi:hypothetical protein
MEHGRSNVDPLLDEDTQSDPPIPSRIVTEGDDTRTMQKITGTSSLVGWADKNVGDTHIGKQKQKTMTKKDKGKKQKRVLGIDEETPSPEGSPKYQESNLSSSTTDTDDGGDGGDQYRIEPSGGGTQFTGDKHNSNNITYMHVVFLNMTNALSFFLREADFTHATEITDHGTPSSQRITMTTPPRG